MKKYKTIQEAVDELNRLNANDEVRELAFYQDIARLDRNTELREAREEGIEQGIQQRNISIAQKMLELKIDIELIMEATGLTKEEIEQIKI